MTALAVTAVALLVPAAVQAHGMVAELRASAPAVVVACFYAGGDPADAEVLVYSPAEPGRIFQTQRTDIRGFASFVPDAAGTWRVVADDGMGHRTELEVAIAAGEEAQPAPRGTPWRTVVLALAVLGLVAAWWGLRNRGRAPA